ncbi:MCM-domain-containing protein [Ramicandelaber brevisporus]|nr:MCM-domain-containing protein [Ramicandelaber brevisporus]
MADQGWDAGRVYSTAVLARISDGDDRTELQQALFDFIQSYFRDGSFVYRDQLRANLLSSRPFLQVDVTDLLSYKENLAHKLMNTPQDILPLFEEAARASARRILLRSTGAEDAIPEIQVSLTNSGGEVINIRDLSSNKISQLVKVSGIVISASSLSCKATYVHIICKNCRASRILPVSGGLASLQLPRSCDAQVDVKDSTFQKCPLDPFIIDHDRSKFIDQQTLKLQEIPELIPVGELPRQILMSADRYLVNNCIPGTRVTVTGIYSVSSQKPSGRDNKSGAGAAAVRPPYLRVVGIEIQRGGMSREKPVFTPQEEQAFIELSRSPNIYERFAKSIAPQIKGHADIKKAVTCLLFGGSKRILPDGMRLRGDINVLLLGDPGTAKSQLLKFVERVSPIAIYTSGKGSSAAGLTASVIRDPSSREFYLEGGAMVLASGGVVCIDEFDKMREDDRVAIHEAMEQQTISIAKAGITTVLNSRTSVLAAANPIFGRYDDMRAPGDNIDFQTTVLSRFDMIFIIRDRHDEVLDRELAKHVLNVHMDRGANAPGAQTGQGSDSSSAIAAAALAAARNNEDLSIELMTNYIRFCKSKCAPRLTNDAAEALSSEYVNIRQGIRTRERDGGERSTIPITIRQLEAIIRITESLAKIQLSPVATAAHVAEAVRLFSKSTIDAANDLGNPGGNPNTGGNNTSMSKKLHAIENEIRKRIPIGSQMAYRRLVQETTRKLPDVTDDLVERAVMIMVRLEVLQFRGQRHLIARIKP